jgi:hypothetical protein
MAAMHRIEQPRHQSQPLALAFIVMIKDVLWHTAASHPSNRPA